ncbi:glucosamine-6-phosphate deaminase [Lactobacillus sp. CC-MHH1034]|uniref:glucosamine-6-phosphate deaminase n=1 Tax=Agrilactobacillus fermenti TaxID=2586909 RepID=UPI001E3FB095|nr:glucosamine-6-phosphate deaminase [Agrilactobacillus fermenti]MCD2257125.1 glucosamine-6-phosphate deaminase [Agrilactobacillus fermenti]
MHVIVTSNDTEAGKKAFEIIKDAIANGAKVLGLATGSTPVKMYDAMVNSDVDFSQMTSVNLDEYVGMAPDNPQSYRYFMQEHLFNKKPFKNTYVPNGLAEDADAETKRYNQVIADNPIDLQVLGIGRNGHIGFNEPGSPFDAQTRKVPLTQSTIDANARFFKDENEVPRYAYSMGIGSIMKSKKIILMAFGEDKADAIKGMIEGPVTTDLPASVLQDKDDVTVIVDKAAASKLSQKSIDETLNA